MRVVFKRWISNRTVRWPVEDLLSPETLARRLDVPVGTLYRWSYVGSGPQPIKIGRHIRYRESEVDRWLDEQAKVDHRQHLKPAGRASTATS